MEKSKSNLDIQSTTGKGTNFKKINNLQQPPHVKQLINELNEKTKLIKQRFVFLI